MPEGLSIFSRRKREGSEDFMEKVARKKRKKMPGRNGTQLRQVIVVFEPV
jgi:hypothetical protein